MAAMREDRPALRRQLDPGEAVVKIGEVRDFDAGQVEQAVAVGREARGEAIGDGALLAGNVAEMRVKRLPERRNAGEVVEGEAPAEAGDEQWPARLDPRRRQGDGELGIFAQRLDQRKAVEVAAAAHCRRRDAELVAKGARERLMRAVAG